MVHGRHVDTDQDTLEMSPSSQTTEHHIQSLKLEKHPGKTFIGKVAKGFDFLGYHFSPQGLIVANITWAKFVSRLHRLYEQKKTQPEWAALIGDYVTRWWRWVQAGINNGVVTIREPTLLTRTI